MFGMKAIPYIGDLARNVDNVVPCGSFGYITTASRYKAAERALTHGPNIKIAVGDRLGGTVALELQKHHPELNLRTYGAPVVDLKGAIQPTLNANTEILYWLGPCVNV